MAVNLYAAVPDGSSIGGAPSAAQTVTDPSGNFAFVGVPPGSYVLKTMFALQQGGNAAFAEISRMIELGMLPPDFATGTARANRAALWASTAVTVADADVTGVTLALREGVRVSVQLVFDGVAPRPTSDQVSSASVIISGPAGAWHLFP
jgi:hypothetical protein